MSTLLGIALVVDDINKGCNLAFRYPAVPAGGSADQVSPFHKLSPSLLAKLFRPKNALCNQSFELVMDDLRFVSHPVLVTHRVSAAAVAHGLHSLHAPLPPGVSSGFSQHAAAGAVSSGASFIGVASSAAAGSMLATAAGGANANAIAIAAAGSDRTETTMFNIIFALEELPQLQEEDADLVQRRRRSISAFRTVAAQLANGLLHEELRSGFVSREVRELLHIRDELMQNERLVNASNGGGGALGGGGGGGGSSNNNSSSVGNHHRNKDGANSESTSSGGVEVDPQTFIDVSLGKSVLANDLKSVFHGLDESGTVHVVINRWVKLSLTLTDSVAVQMHNLRPYHTLLLLADEEKIVASLPADHSQQLRILIDAANPLKSFQEIALETSIPIHHVFRLSAHLVYWGFGKVIDTITLRNIYQVNPQANLRSQSVLALAFRRKFPPHELSEVLSTFSGSRSISEYMKSLSTPKAKTEYIHMLIWLLQQNFITQLHRYVYFMIPSEGDHAADAMGPEGGNSYDENHSFGSNNHSSHSRNNTSFLGLTNALSDPQQQLENFSLQSFISSARSTAAKPKPPPEKSTVMTTTTTVTGASNPFALTDQERDYLDKIATTNPVYTLFKRLCVYFHGQYHLEEIMWRENVSRSELRTVLNHALVPRYPNHALDNRSRAPGPGVVLVLGHGSESGAVDLPEPQTKILRRRPGAPAALVLGMLYGYLSEAIFPMFTTFLTGDVLAVIYLSVYCRYTTERRRVAKLTACVLLWNVVTTLLSFSGDGYMGITDLSRSDTGDIVGYIADVVSLTLYASPFASLSRVIRTKSAVTIPIEMVVVGSVNNSLWLIYGFAISDIIVIVPNVISVLFGVAQMIVYATYNPKKNLGDKLGAEFQVDVDDLEKQKPQAVSRVPGGDIEAPLSPSTCFQSLRSPGLTQA
ncbi:Nitrogen permease regulator 3-like protein, partial [Globisporangium splendens]